MAAAAASSSCGHTVRAETVVASTEPSDDASSSNPVPPPPSDASDGGADSNAAASKARKPAWNVPPDCPVAEVGPVMGAVSWPALSEAVRSTPRAFSSDGSLNSTRTGSVSEGLPPSEPSASAETSQHSDEGPSSQEEDPPNKSCDDSDNQRQNDGGAGPHNARYWNRGRRSHDRSRRWNSNNRDGHLPRPFTRPVAPRPPPPPFIGPPLPVPPFGNPTGYPGMTSPMYYIPAYPHPGMFGGVPFAPPGALPAMFFPPPDASTPANLLSQINYYFSNENLCRDTYLRTKMDDQGWVPISLIAGFPRVVELTKNVTYKIMYILDTLRSSTVVEVQGNRIRRRNDWAKWLLPQPNQSGTASGSQSPASPSSDSQLTDLQSVGLDERTTNLMATQS